MKSLRIPESRFGRSRYYLNLLLIMEMIAIFYLMDLKFIIRNNLV